MGTTEKREYLTIPNVHLFFIHLENALYTEHNYVRHVHIFIHPRLNSNTGKRILYEIITFVVPNNKNNTCIKQHAENNQFL